MSNLEMRLRLAVSNWWHTRNLKILSEYMRIVSNGSRERFPQAVWNFRLILNLKMFVDMPDRVNWRKSVHFLFFSSLFSLSWDDQMQILITTVERLIIAGCYHQHWIWHDWQRKAIWAEVGHDITLFLYWVTPLYCSHLSVVKGGRYIITLIIPPGWLIID